jgi:urease accessory protein UreH
MRFDDATKNTATVLAVNQDSDPFTSAGVDVSNYSHAIVTVLVDTQVGEDILLTIEDSADNSSFAATGASTIAVGASSGLTAKTFHLDTMSVRRYIRLAAQNNGNTMAKIWGAAVWLMNNSQSLATAPTVTK